MEIQYDKRGNGYEESKIYEFSYDELDWEEGCFNGISCSGEYIRTKGNVIFPYIRECQAGLGKVHKKPLELKHGEFYKFHSKSRNSFSKAICGRYNKSEDLIYVGLKWYAIHSCTNIIPMIEATNRT